jgi:hypothetical protein
MAKIHDHHIAHIVAHMAAEKKSSAILRYTESKQLYAKNSPSLFGHLSRGNLTRRREKHAQARDRLYDAVKQILGGDEEAAQNLFHSIGIATGQKPEEKSNRTLRDHVTVGEAQLIMEYAGGGRPPYKHATARVGHAAANKIFELALVKTRVLSVDQPAQERISDAHEKAMEIISSQPKGKVMATFVGGGMLEESDFDAPQLKNEMTAEDQTKITQLGQGFEQLCIKEGKKADLAFIHAVSHLRATSPYQLDQHGLINRQTAVKTGDEIKQWAEQVQQCNQHFLNGDMHGDAIAIFNKLSRQANETGSSIGAVGARVDKFEQTIMEAGGVENYLAQQKKAAKSRGGQIGLSSAEASAWLPQAKPATDTGVQKIFDAVGHPKLGQKIAQQILKEFGKTGDPSNHMELSAAEIKRIDHYLGVVNEICKKPPFHELLPFFKKMADIRNNCPYPVGPDGRIAEGERYVKSEATDKWLKTISECQEAYRAKFSEELAQKLQADLETAPSLGSEVFNVLLDAEAKASELFEDHLLTPILAAINDGEARQLDENIY